MLQDSTNSSEVCRPWSRQRSLGACVGLLVMIGAGVALFVACSTENPDVRQIQGHVTNYDGVAHANAAFAGARHCISCHGATLAGGTNGEPSCYACHGKNWLNDEGAASVAPVDHTVDLEGFRHHPNLNSPAGTCDGCHGSDLHGDISSGLTRPGCQVCHGVLWQ